MCAHCAGRAGKTPARRTLAQLLLPLAMLLAIATAQDDGWREARATYYGAPGSFAANYDPSRGEGSFGILEYGSCGYTDYPTISLPFSRMVAASADADPTYAGSCGTCWEVRCKPGTVINNERQPLTLKRVDSQPTTYYDGDYLRPYLPSITYAKDTKGRSFPGNPAEDEGKQVVQCNPDGGSTIVRIVDSCPCKQVLPDGAPGVAKGGEVRRQEWCCGPVDHMDLSFEAFEKLAHPMYGVMMIERRRVDCDSGKPIDYRTGVSNTIYAGGIKAGWAWRQTASSYAKLQDTGGVTCINTSPNGDVSFIAKGTTPFEGIQYINFYVKSFSGGGYASNKEGEIPPIKIYIRVEGDNSGYCNKEVKLSDVKPASQTGDWYFFSIPYSSWDCRVKPNRIGFQNVGSGNVGFCLDQIVLYK